MKDSELIKILDDIESVYLNYCIHDTLPVSLYAREENGISQVKYFSLGDEIQPDNEAFKLYSPNEDMILEEYRKSERQCLSFNDLGVCITHVVDCDKSGRILFGVIISKDLFDKHNSPCGNNFFVALSVVISKKQILPAIESPDSWLWSQRKDDIEFQSLDYLIFHYMEHLNLAKEIILPEIADISEEMYEGKTPAGDVVITNHEYMDISASLQSLDINISNKRSVRKLLESVSSKKALLFECKNLFGIGTKPDKGVKFTFLGYGKFDVTLYYKDEHLKFRVDGNSVTTIFDRVNYLNIKEKVKYHIKEKGSVRSGAGSGAKLRQV